MTKISMANFRQFWNSLSEIEWHLVKFWNFGDFLDFGNFWDFKWPFRWNDQKCLQLFFVIFVYVDVFYILVEFEDDWMHPHESTKNGRKGAHWLNSNFFLKSKFIFKN